METIIRLCGVLMGKPRNAWCEPHSDCWTEEIQIR